MMICIGGVCVPLNLLVPFLIGLLHRYGYLKWFKQDWVTISYWKKCYARWNGNMPEEKDKGTTSKESQTIQKQDQALKDDKTRVRKAVETAAQENAGSSIEYESPAL